MNLSSSGTPTNSFYLFKSQDKIEKQVTKLPGATGPAAYAQAAKPSAKTSANVNDFIFKIRKFYFARAVFTKVYSIRTQNPNLMMDELAIAFYTEIQ